SSRKNKTSPENKTYDDIIAGNVSKYAVLPAGYYGQPKKGHLIFDACFESGNLGRVDHITEFEYDLFIRPDTCNPRFRVWFNFTVENVKESQVSSMGKAPKQCLLQPPPSLRNSLSWRALLIWTLFVMLLTI
uniref:Cytosolic carboxypeptidase N-terminal domain-containing protein n=1 Tax=Terrapene triunguis TaxID=2587831 RepID=A0A674IU13_9SAUR